MQSWAQYQPLRYSRGVKSESGTKTSPEFARFDALVGKVMSVPPDEVKQRIAQDHETYKPKKKKSKATKTPPR